MKESVLHYIWQYKLFPQHQLTTTDGDCVEIIHTGSYNSDAGPDFFNAKIKIGDTLWAGNVEFHQRSSDWKRHNHINNKAYDNVILHIAEVVDADIFSTKGEKIPQMELKIPGEIQNKYNELLANKTWIPCENKIHNVDAFKINAWKSTLLSERLQQKTEAVYALLRQTENHWEEAFYVSLARSFGFGVNSQPFELTAKSLPQNILAKHKDNLMQLEALLLGQAGFLEDEPVDEYQGSLRNEYRFLKAKYGLKNIDASQWKLLRLRPENFPHVRLAQFATLAQNSSKLFSKILETDNLEELRTFFQCGVSEYWQRHFLFGKESNYSNKRMGKNSIDILLINTVIPFIFAYANKHNAEDPAEKTFHLLEKIQAENNSIIKKWKELGIPAQNAFDSQALLQLKKHYCDEKKCLRCVIGHQVLTLKTAAFD